MFAHKKLMIATAISLLCLILAPYTMAQPGTPNTLPKVAEAFLGTWVGEGENPDGEPFKSELSFAWILNQNFLEVKNEINADGKSQQYARTFYGWQPVLGQLVFWSFDRDGAINEGVAELSDNTLKHQWRSFSKGGEIREWRSTLTRHAPDSLTFKVFDSREQELFSVDYARQKSAKTSD